MEQRVTVEPSGKLLRMILSELSMQFVPLAVGDSIPVHTSSLPALVASAGVAVGLALQGSLSNFAGGVLILLMKPFVIGDYIVQGNTEGTVKEIGLVYTELITADNRLIVIPNGTLIDSSIVNVTATGKRRLELSVGIGYKSDLKKA